MQEFTLCGSVYSLKISKTKDTFSLGDGGYSCGDSNWEKVHKGFRGAGNVLSIALGSGCMCAGCDNQ